MALQLTVLTKNSVNCRAKISVAKGANPMANDRLKRGLLSANTGSELIILLVIPFILYPNIIPSKLKAMAIVLKLNRYSKQLL